MVCVKRLNWNEISDIIEKKQFHLLGRMQEDINVYYSWLKEIKGMYVSVEDYLLCHVMGCQKEAVEVTVSPSTAVSSALTNQRMESVSITGTASIQSITNSSSLVVFPAVSSASSSSSCTPSPCSNLQTESSVTTTTMSTSLGCSHYLGVTKYRAVLPSSSSLSETFVFRRNDFPYAVTPDIQHDVLWSFHPLPQNTISAIVKDQLPGRQFMFFVNPPHLQSIKNLWHAHVFSKLASS